jgi:hypothetical protein
VRAASLPPNGLIEAVMVRCLVIFLPGSFIARVPGRKGVIGLAEGGWQGAAES